MWSFDEELLARQLVRALRGRRSQTALSRRLGYQSNVVYTWESGRRWPSGADLFRLLAKTGRDPREVWRSFSLPREGLRLETREGMAALLAQLRGAAPIRSIAERCGVSRFRVSRWLRGETEPRLPEWLRLVEALTSRLGDLLAAMVEPEAIPALGEHWQAVRARRDIAFSHPWSHAILRQLETVAYRGRRSAASDTRWLARRLGIDEASVEGAIGALRKAGLIRWDGRRHHAESVSVDTSDASSEDRLRLKAHWADVGRERLAAGDPGLFSWAVIALSSEDYERLRALHVGYLRAMRQLVENSERSEVVAVANVQLFELAGR